MKKTNKNIQNAVKNYKNKIKPNILYRYNKDMKRNEVDILEEVISGVSIADHLIQKELLEDKVAYLEKIEEQYNNLLKNKVMFNKTDKIFFVHNNEILTREVSDLREVEDIKNKLIKEMM